MPSQKAQSPRSLMVAGWPSHFSPLRGRERLGAEDALAVDVGRRGHLRATVGRAELAPRPELGHRLVGLAGIGHLVARAAVVGLDRKPQPVPVGQLAECGRHSSPPAGRKPSAAGPRGTARRFPGCRPRGRSSPAGKAAGRSRAAAGTPRGTAASSSASRPPNCRCAWRQSVLPAPAASSRR